MPRLQIAVILWLALAGACAGVEEAPPMVSAQTASVTSDRSPRPATIEEATVAPVAAPVKSQSAAGAALPSAKLPAKPSSVAVKPEQAIRKEPPTPVARMPEPPLDVAALKARLRDTKAIGVFTKLALQNQVDDLLKQFRAHYLSGQKTSVAALRQPYDLLVLKVLALVQDSDPPLAHTILASREAIWEILADPEKFKSVS